MPVFREEMHHYNRNSNSSLFHLYAFGKLYPDAGYIITRKSNPDTIIECVLDGVGYIEADGFVTRVQAGDCYILTPGAAHSYYSDDSNPYTKIWVTLSGALVRQWLTLYGIAESPFVRRFDLLVHYECIEALAQKPQSPQQEKQLMLTMHSVLLEMGLFAAKAGETGKSDAPYMKTSKNVVIDVKKYIEKMCNETLTMRELCGTFGISQKQLTELFAEKYGITPSKYHMQCKLASAVYFLESTDKGIDWICETVGFCDRSHFRKAFVKEYGAAPSTYRKKG